MNECMKHQQRYPLEGWCVYCGKPGDGLQSAPASTPPAPIPGFGWMRVPLDTGGSGSVSTDKLTYGSVTYGSGGTITNASFAPKDKPA